MKLRVATRDAEMRAGKSRKYLVLLTSLPVFQPSLEIKNLIDNAIGSGDSRSSPPRRHHATSKESKGPRVTFGAFLPDSR